MSLWMVVILLGLVKLPVAALMLWLPFRDDQAMRPTAAAEGEMDGAGDSEDDGGSLVPGASPPDPHPRSPRPRPRRRGPHGSSAPPSPGRVRRPTGAGRLTTTSTASPGRGRAAPLRPQRVRLR